MKNFGFLYLNRANKIMSVEKISKAGKLPVQLPIRVHFGVHWILKPAV